MTDASDQITINSDVGIEVASIEVSPKAEANVSLNAHTTIRATAISNGNYQIHRNDCGGTAVAAGSWQIGTADTELTFAVTAVDVVNDTTNYVLCVDRDSGQPDAVTSTRALTATWAPTA